MVWVVACTGFWWVWWVLSWVWTLYGIVLALLLSPMALQWVVNKILPRTIDGWVVITGCDHGLGRMVATTLDAQNVRVVGLCLTQDGVDSLNAVLTPPSFALQTDVRDRDAIQLAVDAVEAAMVRHGGSLSGLVNNAGIAPEHAIGFTPLDTYADVMGVNTLGVVYATKLFLPLLKAGSTTVVNVASLAGRIGSPHMGGYCASKHAVEGWSDAMRRELSVWGISTVLVEPGFTNTPMVANSGSRIEALYTAADQETRDEYGSAWREHNMALERDIRENAVPPQGAVATIVGALQSPYPFARYVTWYGDVPMLFFFSYLPSWVGDLATSLVFHRVPPGASSR